MALIQALLSLLTRSAGKVLNAVFGWAVRALFGDTKPSEQTLLSGLVGAAVAWPLLLIGLAAPKFAALILAAVPIPHWISGNVIRLVWLGLALLIPLLIGWAVALKAPPQSPPESVLRRVLRGFPITVGLAAAFLIMFISVPVLKVINIARGRSDLSVPLITDARVYHQVAELMVRTLNEHGFFLKPSTPSFWVVAPVKILLKLGGKAFRHYVPERLEQFGESELEVAFYPSGVTLRGGKRKTTWAHSLIVEAVIGTEALQTSDAQTQNVERDLRRLWRLLHENDHHVHSPRLAARLDEVAQDLARIEAPYDDWQVVYRQTLQVSRALAGQPPLLATKTPADGETMEKTDKKVDWLSTSLPSAPADVPPDNAAETPQLDVKEMPLRTLIGEVGEQTSLLVRKHVELAKAEIQADFRKEIAMVKRLSLAGLSALLFANMAFVTLALALSLIMRPWHAGLLVTVALLVIAGAMAALGWSKRVKEPLARTRAAVKEDVKWTKERLA